MLQTIRDKTTGTAAIFVVAIICVPFAFFGIEQFASGGGDPAVAKVDGEKITQREFSNGYDQAYQRFQQLLGDNFDPALVQSPQFRQSVLQGLIQDEVMSQHIADTGYRVGEARAFESIRSQPAFQVGDEFSPEAYRRTLQARGFRRPETYEALVKQSLAQGQLETGVRNSSFVVPAEVELAYKLEHQTRRFKQLRFAAADYRDKVELDDDAVRARYDENPERFRTEERVKLQYIDVNASAISADAEPTEEELRALYEAEQSRFSTPEERLTRHILIKTGNARDADAARAEIEALRARIVDGGEDFAEVAKAESEDAGSAAQGGSLDWVRRGMMVTPFEEAMFALDAGVVSAPVETDFGWHIILVDEIREPSVKPFEDADVQAQLTRSYQRRMAEEQFQALADQVEQLTFENPESLQPAAEASGLEVQETGWITRSGGPGIAQFPSVIDAAFSSAVLELEENSEMVGVDDTRAIVLRKLAYEPSEIRPFDEVEAQIRSELISRRAQEMAREAAEAALAEAETGKPLDVLAAEYEAALADSGSIERNDTTGREDVLLDPSVVRQVFVMPPPSGDARRYQVMQASNGDAVLVALESVQAPAAPNKDAIERRTLAARLRNASANAELNAFQAGLRADASVKIYQDRLEDGSDPALGG